MKIIGIIAEYNPFHNGHAYQIKKIKEDLQADYVIIAMSGDFVQRGAPSIIDKYARTEMALSCGADLVIELPVLWATASAELFAMAGVTLFDKMGCVDSICFGAETDDLNMLSRIADTLVSEPPEYRASLSSYLKSGMVFPAARSKALSDYLSNISNFTAVSEAPASLPDLEKISSILNEPNNILAIEYLKALKRRHSSMVPYIIKREGAGYHNTEFLPEFSNYDTCNLSDNIPALTEHTADIPTASATAIRKALTGALSKTTCSTEEKLAAAMPASALSILENYLRDNTLVEPNDFSSILGYNLLTADRTILADIGDSNSDIANRFFKNRMNFSSFEQFCEGNKSKDVTYTRISRVLLHFILNIKNKDYDLGKELDYIPYLRILGFRKPASALLKTIKTASDVPLISKLADAPSFLNEHAMTILEKDIFSADLYSQICANKNATVSRSEYTRKIVRI